MWRDYFGSGSEIYGVDIESACLIFIGDQADRNVWRHPKQEIGSVDIVIDDGGHEPQ